MSRVTCNDGDNVDPSDDFLSFTVTATGGNSGYISNIPLNATIIPDDCYNDMNNRIWIPCLSQMGGATINLPSEGCTPISLTLDWRTGNCEDETILIIPSETIPTLGQWGIILLGLICAIFGINKIRQTSLALSSS